MFKIVQNGMYGLFLCPLLASAQLTVTVSPVKITGQKAVWCRWR
jgi:hypothetical protein